MARKASSHVVTKLIRKKIIDFNEDNLNEKINDLIGIRLLHVFEKEWEYINDFLFKNFRNITEVVFYHDGIDDFEMRRIKSIFPVIKFVNKGNGYKSIHYNVRLEPDELTKDPYPIWSEYKRDSYYYCEIQVRTLFQEAWGEISHKIIYPHSEKNRLLSELAKNLTNFSNGADELATYLLNLKQNF